MWTLPSMKSPQYLVKGLENVIKTTDTKKTTLIWHGNKEIKI